jgi:uncharacterized protein YeaO (DUF488 family)
MIITRRVYDTEEPGEQYRVLIDRLWPRGISKEKAGWDKWVRDVAPSDQLRKWYNHDPGKWEEFKQLYEKELADKQQLLKELLMLESEHKILTLLYSSKEKEINNAIALKEFLLKRSLSDYPSIDK